MSIGRLQDMGERRVGRKGGRRRGVNTRNQCHRVCIAHASAFAARPWPRARFQDSGLRHARKPCLCRPIGGSRLVLAVRRYVLTAYNRRNIQSSFWVREAREIRTQHFDQSLQQRSRIPILNDNRKRPDVHDIILPHQLIGDIAEDIKGL